MLTARKAPGEPRDRLHVGRWLAVALVALLPGLIGGYFLAQRVLQQAEQGTATVAPEVLTPQEERVLRLVNEARQNDAWKPTPVSPDPRLCQAARTYAAVLAKQHRLDDGLDGWDTAQRVRHAGYAFEPDGLKASMIFGRGMEPEEAVQLWLRDSVAHEGIVGIELRHAGVGIASDSLGHVYYYLVLAQPARQASLPATP